MTRLALQQADLVIAVARADPIGLHDFIRGYQQLRDIGIDPRQVRVVVNQVRGELFEGDAVPQIRAALNRYLGVEPSIFVPYDRGAMDNALMAGKALREVRRGSGPQQAMEALAAVVVGAPAAAPQRRRQRRRVVRRRTVLWNGRPSDRLASIVPPVKYCPYTVAAAGRDHGRGDLLPIVRGEAHR